MYKNMKHCMTPGIQIRSKYPLEPMHNESIDSNGNSFCLNKWPETDISLIEGYKKDKMFCDLLPIEKPAIKCLKQRSASISTR